MRRKRRSLMSNIRRFLFTTVPMTMLALVPTAASALDHNGTFSTVTTNKNFQGACPSRMDAECGAIEVRGLGTADWVYAFGPTFEPTGHKCFKVDGSFSLTLRSDGSSISGPLTGVFCPRESDTAHQIVGTISYGNPFYEDDVIALGEGKGTLTGTLSRWP